MGSGDMRNIVPGFEDGILADYGCVSRHCGG